MSELVTKTVGPDETAVETADTANGQIEQQVSESDKTTMEEEDKPALKTGLTENLQDMGIESAEDTNDGVEEMDVDETDEENITSTNQQQDGEVPKPEDEAPKPEDGEMPKPNNESPKPEDEAPKPEDGEMPKPEDEEMAKPEDEEVPKPEDEEMPKPEDEEVPKPEDEEVPKPEDEEVPKPEDEEVPKPGDDEVPKPEDGKERRKEESQRETVEVDELMPQQKEDQVGENLAANNKATNNEQMDQDSESQSKSTDNGNVTDDEKMSETKLSDETKLTDEEVDDSANKDSTTEKFSQESTSNERVNDLGRPPIRRSRSKEEETEPGEKGKTDEGQSGSSAKKPKKDPQPEPRRTTRSKPDFTKWRTIEDFGYKFNQNGQLRQIKSGSKFVFEVAPNDRSYNQKHYEALGEIITTHVFKLMEEECKLEKVYVPVEATEKDPRTFIFVSKNARSVPNGEDPPSDKKLLVLIHGSGVVRAGQWARRLIINNNLDMGTMIPYIKKAIADDYEVMLLNTNYNSDKGRPIPGSSNPEAHGKYVWEKFIRKWPGKVAIVAHSAGGYVTVEMAKQCEGFLDKVFAVGFTDSVHSLGYYTSSNVRDWFKKHSKNWVSSSKELNTVLSSYGGDCERVSAGTPKHEETSYYSMESIFKYFEKMLTQPTEEEEEHQEPDVVEVGSESEAPEDQDITRGADSVPDEPKRPWWHFFRSITLKNILGGLFGALFGGVFAMLFWYCISQGQSETPGAIDASVTINETNITDPGTEIN